MKKFCKTTVSKAIGFCEGPQQSIPTKEKFMGVYNSACNKESYQDALNIFYWYRFCKSPENEQEKEVMDLICNAFKELFE